MILPIKYVIKNKTTVRTFYTLPLTPVHYVLASRMLKNKGVNMEKQKFDTLIVPNLWWNINGPVYTRLSENHHLIDLCGIRTMKKRAIKLEEYLKQRPWITTLVGHGVGSLIILETLKRITCGTIKMAVLANPAPAYGVKFGFSDTAFWIALKYILKARKKKKDFMLSQVDFAKLFFSNSNNSEDYLIIEEVMKNLQPDSAEFISELFWNQFKPKKCYAFCPKSTKLLLTQSYDNRFLGNTIFQTLLLLTRDKPIEMISGGYGHLWPILHVDQILTIAETKLMAA